MRNVRRGLLPVLAILVAQAAWAQSPATPAIPPEPSQNDAPPAVVVPAPQAVTPTPTAPVAPVPAAPVAPAPQISAEAVDALMRQGQEAFEAEKFSAALAKFAAAAQADPGRYDAALLAGDAAYSLRDGKTAAEWFAKAIAMDPDRETAYRYWGDALLRVGGQPAAAKQKFMDAVVAEPYSAEAWRGLRQWAELAHAEIEPPSIDRPSARVFDEHGEVNVSASFSPTKDPRYPNASAWSMYRAFRAGYKTSQFAADHPGEAVYRDSLKEEEAALTLVIHTIQEMIADHGATREKLEPGLRRLMELNDAAMLDCWILINGYDAGIQKDYAAYRQTHRTLLHDYLELFVVHDGR